MIRVMIGMEELLFFESRAKSSFQAEHDTFEDIDKGIIWLFNKNNGF